MSTDEQITLSEIFTDGQINEVKVLANPNGYMRMALDQVSASDPADKRHAVFKDLIAPLFDVVAECLPSDFRNKVVNVSHAYLPDCSPPALRLEAKETLNKILLADVHADRVQNIRREHLSPFDGIMRTVDSGLFVYSPQG